jgi:hypothetical protein
MPYLRYILSLFLLRYLIYFSLFLIFTLYPFLISSFLTVLIPQYLFCFLFILHCLFLVSLLSHSLFSYALSYLNYFFSEFTN